MVGEGNIVREYYELAIAAPTEALPVLELDEMWHFIQKRAQALDMESRYLSCSVTRGTRYRPSRYTNSRNNF